MKNPSKIKVKLLACAMLLVASIASASFAQSTTGRGVTPVKANRFLNSLGVVTHITQGIDSPAQVISGLEYTGIRNIRDDATHYTSLYATYCNIHSTTGAMIDLVPIVDDDPNNIQDSLTQYEAIAACGAMLAAEGPNQPNNFPFTYNGQTCGGPNPPTYAACAAYQIALYAAVYGDSKLANKRVWAQTKPGAQPDNQGLQFLQIPSRANTLQPPGTRYADFANLHNSVRGNGQNQVQDNQAWYAEANGASRGSWDGLDGEFIGNTWREGFAAAPLSAGRAMPKVTTETGWPTDGSITEDQQGKLFVNLYLSAKKRNWSHTFIYMMFDEFGQNYGLFHQNATPKPAATYIHNLTSILNDTTSLFSPVALSYSITGSPATVHNLLMQKSNGTYELLLLPALPGYYPGPRWWTFSLTCCAMCRANCWSLWDRLPGHKARLTQEFIAAQDGRLITDYLPAYAPELNPVQYIWGYWKHHQLPNFCPHDFTELSFFGRRALRRMRRRPTLVRSFWQQACLSL
jgi:hypothetical protein